jgi:prepilin-type processing-associated H-X9-DG protein
MLVWDHDQTPACSVYGSIRPPCQPYVNPQTTHYPTRHSGMHNVVYCDGHVMSMLQTELTDALFYVN